MKFVEQRTPDSCVMAEESSDFKITATSEGVKLSGTTPFFHHNSCLEPFVRAMGIAVTWHLKRVEAKKAFDLASQSEVESPTKDDLAGKF